MLLYTHQTVCFVVLSLLSFCSSLQLRACNGHVTDCYVACKNTITSTQPTFLPWRFGLYQRHSSEEVCSVPLPVLATIVMWRGKKSVVRVAQRVAPLVRFNDCRRSFRLCTASLIQLVLLSDSLSKIMEAGQLITWLRELHAEPHVRPISCHVASLSWQEPEEELNKLLLMKVSDRDRNVKVKMLVVLK